MSWCKKGLKNCVVYAFVLVLFSGGAVTSCSLAPAQNVISHHLFFYVREKIKESTAANYADRARDKALALYKKVPYIIYAGRGQNIEFVQQAIEPRSDSLVYSLGNGRYRLSRALYMSMSGKNSVLSLDGERWFISGASAAVAGNNLALHLEFAKITEDRQKLRVPYRAQLLLAPKLRYHSRYTQIMNKRPVRRGRHGDYIALRGRQKLQNLHGRTATSQKQICAASVVESVSVSPVKQADNTLNLQELILFYPQGFEFYYRLCLQGNLLQATTEGPVTRVEFQRDIYFYYPHRFFAAISWDGKDWRHSYFDFHWQSFNSSFFATALQLQYIDGISFNYKD